MIRNVRYFVGVELCQANEFSPEAVLDITPKHWCDGPLKIGRQSMADLAVAKIRTRAPFSAVAGGLHRGTKSQLTLRTAQAALEVQWFACIKRKNKR